MNMQIYDAYFHLLEIIPFFFYFNLRFLFKTVNKTNKKLENKSYKILLLFKNEKEENPAYEWAAEIPFCWQITQQPK